MFVSAGLVTSDGTTRFPEIINLIAQDEVPSPLTMSFASNEKDHPGGLAK